MGGVRARDVGLTVAKNDPVQIGPNIIDAAAAEAAPATCEATPYLNSSCQVGGTRGGVI